MRRHLHHVTMKWMLNVWSIIQYPRLASPIDEGYADSTIMLTVYIVVGIFISTLLSFKNVEASENYGKNNRLRHNILGKKAPPLKLAANLQSFSHKLQDPFMGGPIKGLPIGDKGGLNGECMHCNCWNSNKFVSGDAPSTNIKFGEKDLCENLIQSIGQSHGNAHIFFSSCRATLGSVCNHQCLDLAALFDRMDFTAVPPSAMKGGVGYAFNVRDCMNCLLEGDCYPKPNGGGLAAKPIVSAPWYGDTQASLREPSTAKWKIAAFRL
jgi:hypothetical protein